MTPDESVRATAARLGAVDWQRHGHRTWSKAKLMLEYFRRVARWVEASGLDEPVPFFDLAHRLDPTVRADPVPLARWRERASRPPLASLDPAALDEIDRAGSMRQFGHVIGPAGGTV